jgi:hypothetical protein
MGDRAKRPRIDLSELATKYVEPVEVYEDPEDDADHISPFTHVLEGESLTEYLGLVRDALYDEQEAIQELLPYACDEGWPWVVEEYKPGHNPLIVAVLTILFGVFMRMCVGSLDDSGSFVATELFLPVGIQGRSSSDRAGVSPCYTDPGNPRVYRDLSSPMTFYISTYVNMLKTLGYFTGGDGDYLAPPHLFNDAIRKIQLQLLGDQNTSPQPTGGLEERLGHGMRQIKMPRRRQWAIRDQIIIVPDPMERQDWEKRVFIRARRPHESAGGYAAMVAKQKADRRKYIAQIHLVDPVDDEVPCIPSGRHFNDVDADSFLRLFKIVNGAISKFVELKDAKTSEYDLQQWVSTLSVDLLHDYCPNFMSYIGAQYLQRICIEQQDDTFVGKKPGAPRAYFSNKTKERPSNAPPQADEAGAGPAVEMETYRVYRDAMTSNDDRLVASMVEVFGSMFYSIKTYISAFVGNGGTGKNFIRRIAIKIAGGLKHTFRIDPNHHKFSLSMLKAWTFLLTVEDASDTQLEIPKTFMDSALGGTRGVREEGGNIEAKFGHPEQELVEPLGCCYLRNDPTEEAKALVGKSRQEKAIACVQGMSGGKDRRVRLAPPLMVRVTEGPINPTDEYNDLAFDHNQVDGEIPYLMLISWFTTVGGDLCRDDIYGLVGEGGCSELEDLNKQYLAMGTTNVNENVNRLLENIPEKVFKCNVDVRSRRVTEVKYCYGASLSSIKDSYFKAYKIQLKTLPDEFPTPKEKMRVCRDCGLHININTDIEAVILAAHANTTDPDKDQMIAPCPYDGVSCYKKMVRSRNILYGYRLRRQADPVGDGSE